MADNPQQMPHPDAVAEALLALARKPEVRQAIGQVVASAKAGGGWRALVVPVLTMLGVMVGVGVPMMMRSPPAPVVVQQTAAAPVDQSKLYPAVDLKTVAAGKWVRPRATLTGTVAEVRNEDDGDVHIRLTDGTDFVVCEIIPRLKLNSPKVGMKIQAKGIVRYDGEHKFFELHPLEEWEEVPAPKASAAPAAVVSYTPPAPLAQHTFSLGGPPWNYGTLGSK